LIHATLNLLLSIRCKYVFIVLSTAVERLPAPICPRIKDHRPLCKIYKVMREDVVGTTVAVPRLVFA